MQIFIRLLAVSRIPLLIIGAGIWKWAISYLFIFFAVFFRQKCNNIQMTMQPFYGFEMGNNLLTRLSGLVHVQPIDGECLIGNVSARNVAQI